MRIDLRPQRPQFGFGDLAPHSLFSVPPVSFLLLGLQGFEPAADLPGDGAYEADFAVEQMAAARARSNGEQMGRFSFHPRRSEKFDSGAQLPFRRIIETQFADFAAVEGRREMIDLDGGDRNHTRVFQFQRFANKARNRLKNSLLFFNEIMFGALLTTDLFPDVTRRGRIIRLAEKPTINQPAQDRIDPGENPQKQHQQRGRETDKTPRRIIRQSIGQPRQRPRNQQTVAERQQQPGQKLQTAFDVDVREAEISEEDNRAQQDQQRELMHGDAISQR